MYFNNRDQLKDYLSAEKNIYFPGGGPALPFSFREKDVLWRYVKCLRKVEYYEDTDNKFLSAFFRIKLKRLTLKYAIHIPPHVFEKGLSIAHIGPVLVNGGSEIGANCRIHVGVSIGPAGGNCPVIGNNVYIGPGAKIFGDIYIADDIKIGANAVVNKSCDIVGATLVGVPARAVIK